ncbi:MAG: radical SAM protein, partial [Candidatus Neomarinimicrobiota bacterium]
MKESRMLKQIHFLLTYKCTSECDHCFVYSSPEAKGVFTLSGLKNIFSEIKRIPTVDTVYFEGGEAFLYYPLLLDGIRRARRQGLKSGVVTNAYWANSVEDAILWLRPFVRLGIADLSISDDEFHRNTEVENRAEFALAAAQELGLPAATIRIE